MGEGEGEEEKDDKKGKKKKGKKEKEEEEAKKKKKPNKAILAAMAETLAKQKEEEGEAEEGAVEGGGQMADAGSEGRQGQSGCCARSYESSGCRGTSGRGEETNHERESKVEEAEQEQAC